MGEVSAQIQTPRSAGFKYEVENEEKKVDVYFLVLLSQVSFFFSCTLDLKIV